MDYDYKEKTHEWIQWLLLLGVLANESTNCNRKNASVEGVLNQYYSVQL